MCPDRVEPFEVDAARDRDAGELARLAARCFADPWTKADFRRALQDREHTVVLVGRRNQPGEAGEGQDLAGYLVLRIVADELEILDLGVDPSFRRLGLGRRLLVAALDQGAKRGARTAYLEVRESNEAAKALYTALGFRSHSRRPGYYRDSGEGALVLRREEGLGNRS